MFEQRFFDNFQMIIIYEIELLVTVNMEEQAIIFKRIENY